MAPNKLSPVDCSDCLSDSGYPQLKEMLTAYKSLKSGMKPEHAYRLIGTAFVSAMDAYCHTEQGPDFYTVPAWERSQHSVVVKERT